jgi:predicted peptidase
MFKTSSTLIFLSFFIFQSMAQDLALFEKYWLTIDEHRMPYRLLLPENYDANQKYPLIFFLHGSGERGNDNEAQLVHGAKAFLNDDFRKNYPAIVVFPQCAKESYWSNVMHNINLKSRERSFYFQKKGAPTSAMELAGVLLEYLLDTYPVDTERVYIGGLSMGGMGAFEMVKRHPGVFAAAFPICGGANPATASYMKDVSWWIFHGAKDDVVPPYFSEDMAKSLEAVEADVKLTIYPDANHNSWDSAFAEKELFPWLFAQHR